VGAAGDRGDIPYDLFSRPECDALLRRAAERFDYVLLDTPPILGVADARILAGKVDRVLYCRSVEQDPAARGPRGGADPT
jgi:Mrp family chromosome partitioning ATPase